MSEITATGKFLLRHQTVEEEVEVDPTDLDWEVVSVDNRNMGSEVGYVAHYRTHTENSPEFVLQVYLYEYPTAVLNYEDIELPNEITVAEKPTFDISPTLSFHEQVARELQETGFTVRPEAALHGARLDYTVEAPDGKMIAFDLKETSQLSLGLEHEERTSARVEEAKRTVQKYRKHLKTNDFYLVLSGLKKNDLEAGLLSPEKLSSFVRANLPHSKTKTSERKTPEKKIFAAMPFEDKFEDTFLVAIRGASEEAEANAASERVDKTDFHGDIVFKIKRMIRQSDVVIADLTGSNANVLYEAGFAHALGVPVIFITSGEMSEIPFDVRNERAISYSIGSTHHLKTELTDSINALFEGHGTE